VNDVFFMPSGPQILFSISSSSDAPVFRARSLSDFFRGESRKD